MFKPPPSGRGQGAGTQLQTQHRVKVCQTPLSNLTPSPNFFHPVKKEMPSAVLGAFLFKTPSLWEGAGGGNPTILASFHLSRGETHPHPHTSPEVCQIKIKNLPPGAGSVREPNHKHNTEPKHAPRNPSHLCYNPHHNAKSKNPPPANPPPKNRRPPRRLKRSRKTRRVKRQSDSGTPRPHRGN